MPRRLGSAEQRWRYVAMGTMHTCAIDPMNRLSCTGSRSMGQLGDGVIASPREPKHIDGAWLDVSAARDTTCARSVGGIPHCAGLGADHQLGLGTLRDEQLLQPLENAAWTRVVAGIAHGCGIRGGKVVCWGTSFVGQVGKGTMTPSPTPTVVADGTYVAASDHTCAIGPAKALSCWGNNDAGQLGLGHTNQVLSPMQVGAGTWDWVTAGNKHTCATTGGAVWCWGEGSSGELGGGQSDALMPRAITQPGTYQVVDAGFQSNCALNTTSGSLACWGRNGHWPHGRHRNARGGRRGYRVARRVRWQ